MADKKRGKNGGKRLAPLEEIEQDLTRFGGSSDEEDRPKSDLDESESDEEGPHTSQHGKDETKRNEKNMESDGDGDDEHKDSDISDFEENNITGMANAMSKILGVEVKTGTQSVVLSKTKTPLQRQAAQERELLKEARQKRKLNRDRHLAALCVPLSVATSKDLGGGSSALVKELERERAHRRVATRGVVALFNAIAQHQHNTKEVVSPTNKTDGKNATKHSFLDQIKSAAAKKEEERDQKEITTKQAAKTNRSSSKWLDESFMLGAKLKDWDKESSDEGSDGNPNDDWDDDNTAPSPSKRRKVQPQ